MVKESILVLPALYRLFERRPVMNEVEPIRGSMGKQAMNKPTKWLTVCIGGTLLALAFLSGCERDTYQNAWVSLKPAI